jgi:hypothetical protein
MSVLEGYEQRMAKMADAAFMRFALRRRPQPDLLAKLTIRYSTLEYRLPSMPGTSS